MKWKTIDGDEIDYWVDMASAFVSAPTARQIECPSCASVLSTFFRRAAERRGGLWIWCSHCGRHYHSSCLVPDWWIDDFSVPDEKLTDPPDALEAWFTSNIY